MKNIKDNIYILALEKGVICNFNGISYNEMIEYLRTEHCSELPIKYEHYFQRWFFSNFYEVTADTALRGGSVGYNSVKFRPEELSIKAYLRGESYINYLDYIELKEARQSSKQAKTIAIWAIGISGFLALTSIIMSAIQIN